MSVADGRVMVGTTVNTGLADTLTLVGHPRFRTIAFLGAAQIDRYGNLNSTCIGNYHRPKTRFPGSGGACDALSTAYATIIFMTHDKTRFVEPWTTVPARDGSREATHVRKPVSDAGGL